MNRLPTAATTWSERYEALRRQVLAGEQTLGNSAPGLVVVCRQGLAGWIRRWIHPAEAQSPTGRPILTSAAFLHGELSGLLAQMTVGHLLTLTHL